MKCKFVYAILILHILLSTSNLTSAVIIKEIPRPDQTMKRATKKDLFVSRGWAAGGMPFSVLYMNPYSSKTPHLAEMAPRSADIADKKIKMKKPQKSRTFAKHRSVIPQLFVSYGWGPLGKK